MPGREAYALRRNQVAVGVMRLGQVLVHHLHHFIGGMRAGDRQHLGMRIFHHIAFCTETAGDNHLAVFLQRFADGVERFFHRAVDKTAGVHHHQIGVLITAGDDVTLGAQTRQDTL